MEIAKPKEFKLKKEPEWWIVDENGGQMINPNLLERFKELMDDFQIPPPIQPYWDNIPPNVDWTYRPGDTWYGNNTTLQEAYNNSIDPILYYKDQGQLIGVSSRQFTSNDISY